MTAGPFKDSDYTSDNRTANWSTFEAWAEDCIGVQDIDMCDNWEIGAHGPMTVM